MIEIATFGAGCFWCTEAVYWQLRGVRSVMPGYTSGNVPHPTNDQVCSGTTGHVEVAQIQFDPDVISFKQLVEVFFVTHNPTTLNRQGNDAGSQYRSVIFYHSDTQKQVAESVKRHLEQTGTFSDPIVTETEPAGQFYPAEHYHRDYYARNPTAPYCTAIIDPKIAKLRHTYAALLKA